MNYFNVIYKSAADPVTTTAGGLAGLKILDFILHGGKKALDIGAGAVNKLVDTVPGLAYGGMVVGGLGAGYGLARLLNPKAVANNSDKLLESEALATEIEVTERRLKALEARRKARKNRATGEQSYDRFV